MVRMRDNVSARFKYCESTAVSPPSPSSSATPSSTPTPAPSPSMTATTDVTTPDDCPRQEVCGRLVARPSEANACPSRDLIQQCLRAYYRQMEDRSSSAWQAVSQRILEDLAPYSVLKLGGFSLGNVCTKLLSHVLTLSTTLKTLDLGFNRITDKGAVLLARALERNTSLQQLYLSGNEIGPIGATALANALKVNRTLQTLHLSGNNIGEDGAAALAEGLQHNLALRALYLGTNGIGSNGMKSLAQALQVNEALEELTLGQNKIGSDGLRHVAAMLSNTTTRTIRLTTLEIGKNGIDHTGALALAQALARHPHRLQNLYFDNNPIGDAGASAFGALLAKNSVLRVLDVSYTEMSLLGLRELSMGLSYSRSLLCLLVDGHDWASTKYMKKNNALQGMQLSAKGASNFAASCIVGAVNSNAESALFKLTGVDLSLIVSSLPISPQMQAELMHGPPRTAGPTGSAPVRHKPMDQCTRNERILRFLRANRRLLHNQKRKNADEPSADASDASSRQPQLQRQKTREDFPSLRVNTSLASSTTTQEQTTNVTTAPSALDAGATAKCKQVYSQPPAAHLALKSPRYETTMEVQVRKVVADIAQMPFSAQELATLEQYYLGTTSPKGADGHVNKSEETASVDDHPVNDASTPTASTRLARYPRTLEIKERRAAKESSQSFLLILLRQLHYLVNVFRHVDNAEAVIDNILAAAHDSPLSLR
ncbi:TPA: hypothetical protein N0F65_008466 [Lagenidium giganteum]|uniref:Uncharacterized protein n=1 Tax=Lagenidium giganteum TaxID=4803 RepID=A0AAV2YI33_9STRA|nr:TPA: hypothetical protein N0F65_008466 [Lagenidium giganteum]